LKDKVEKLIKNSQTYAEQLGIDIDSKKPNEIFKWFLASLLFGKPITESIVIKTYNLFVKEGLVTPQKILAAGWDRLVEILDKGGYVRYDFSTADKLLEIMTVIKNYPLEKIYKDATDSKNLEKLLMEIRGIGPVTVNIFLRELRYIWPKADPNFSPFVKLAAKKLKINLNKYNRHTKKFVKLEAALIRIGKKLAHRRSK
jgi:endonuclease III